MDIIANFFKSLQPIVPTVVALVGAVIFIFAVRLVLEKRFVGIPGHKFRRQITTLVLYRSADSYYRPSRQ